MDVGNRERDDAQPEGSRLPMCPIAHPEGEHRQGHQAHQRAMADEEPEPHRRDDGNCRHQAESGEARHGRDEGHERSESRTERRQHVSHTIDPPDSRGDTPTPWHTHGRSRESDARAWWDM